MAGSLWQFADGNASRQEGISAPVYDDVLSSFLGQTYFTPGKYDPALAMTLNAGGKGSLRQGLDAFIAHGSDDTQDPLSNAAAAGYKASDLQGLASQFGIDPNAGDLEAQLRDRTKDYYSIGGMSAGWNPTGDARQGNQTLYQRQDGKLVPLQTNAGHIADEGGWLQEHKGILAPLAVLTGGLAYGAIGAGAGAGTAGGAAAGGGAAGAAGTGITGTAGASGMAAYGAGVAPGAFATAGTGSLGAGLGGMGGYLGAGSLAGSLAYGGLGSGSFGFGAGAGGGSMFGQAGDWYNSLPKYQQAALRGAGQSGLQSGGDPRAMARGAITGGLGAGVSDYLGGGFLGNIGGRLASMGGGALFNGLMGGQGAPQGGGGGGSSPAQGGAGGGSGGGSSTLGGLSASSSAGGGGGGGLSAGWRLPSAADAATASYLKQSYAPIALEAQKKRLAESLSEGLGG